LSYRGHPLFVKRRRGAEKERLWAPCQAGGEEPGGIPKPKHKRKKEKFVSRTSQLSVREERTRYKFSSRKAKQNWDQISRLRGRKPSVRIKSADSIHLQQSAIAEIGGGRAMWDEREKKSILG